VCAEEDNDGWSCLYQDLRTRGVATIDLIVTDGQEGLLAAVTSLFQAKRIVIPLVAEALLAESEAKARRSERR